MKSKAFADSNISKRVLPAMTDATEKAHLELTAALIMRS
jgi:hypothetical protein